MSDDQATKDALLSQLRAQRRHVLGALEGLGEDDLHRSVLPTGWTPLGMVQHLALDVERFWFRRVVAGEEVELCSGDEAWQVDPDMASEQVLAAYREEAELADEVVAAHALDSDPAWWPDFFGDLPPRDLLRTILHVTVETATHAGHRDAARELIDGGTWLVLTDE